MANWKIDQLENVMGLLGSVHDYADVYDTAAIKANVALACKLLNRICSDESQDVFTEKEILIIDVVDRLDDTPELVDDDKLYQVEAHAAYSIPILNEVYRMIERAEDEVD